MSVNNLIGHKVYLSNLVHLYKENKLPNKILLSGYKGIGKALLVKNFLYKIFDDNNSHVLINNNSHPNILNIKKKDDKKIIEIDQIRDIIKFTNQSSFNNKSKFIIIDDVEYLNQSSSNALLKSLEEPNFNVNFFLVYNSNLKILDTIKSRAFPRKGLLKSLVAALAALTLPQPLQATETKIFSFWFWSDHSPEIIFKSPKFFSFNIFKLSRSEPIS